MRTFSILLLLLTTTAYPAAAGGPTPAQVGELVEKVGISSVNAWLKEKKISIPASSVSEQERSKALEQTLAKYAQIRNSYYADSETASWAGVGAVGAFGAVALYGGPQAAYTIPATLMAAAAGAISDNVANSLDTQGAEVGRRFLAANKNTILKELGVSSYAQLGNDPQIINDTFNTATDLLADLRSRAGGDQIQADYSRDLLIDTLVATTGATLDTLDLQGDKLSTLDNAFTQFVKTAQQFQDQTTNSLQKNGTELDTISSQVKDLTNAVSSVDQQLSQQGRNQAFVSDFILDEMDPAQKAKSLEGGFLSERFKCASGVDECAGSKMKDSLIVRFKAEANLKASLDTVSAVAGGIGQVAQIASNLGIDSPDLNKAVQVGNAAANALAAYASGNPIGAVMAITGIFAQQKDPDAERFEVMMKALAQIDHKLDIIIQNQKALMEAVNQLSAQLEKDFQTLNGHLASVKWEQDRMSEAVRQLIWKDWKSCNDFVDEASTRTATGEFIFIDERSHRFRSFDDMQKVFEKAGLSFAPCLITLRGGTASLDNVARFGNFIDARLAYNAISIIEPNTLGPDKDKWTSVLQHYETDLFDPANTLARAALFDEGIDSASKLPLLSSPAQDLTTLSNEIKAFKDVPFQCYSGSERDKRFYPLICGDPAASPGFKTELLLARPVLADFANELAYWVLPIAQMADLYDQKAGRIYTSVDELIANKGGSGVGRDLIAKSIIVLDLAISSYDQMYGGATARGAASVLDDRAGQEAGDIIRLSKAEVIKLLINNSYLAQNTAITLLTEHRKDGSAPIDPETYRSAYSYAERDTAHRDFMLAGLFDDRLSFAVNSAGVPCLHLAAENQALDIPLPAPNQLVEGRFVFPQRFYQLLTARDILVDRWFDYSVMNLMSEGNADAVAAALVR